MGSQKFGPSTFQPDKPCPVWENENWLSRLHKCRKTLYLHGFLTDAENREVMERLPQEIVER